MVATFTLLRHGQVAGPAALYGHTNVALSEQGYNAMHASMKKIHALQSIDTIVSSPLIRCAQLAELFSTQSFYFH
ncbi:MAG: hypothetical protein EOP48_18730 [Sphingobacteriales bacterium]|nr:MAG: hypothetical protein EOP48_18730 [Sphingobacteriales bacterium]